LTALWAEAFNVIELVLTVIPELADKSALVSRDLLVPVKVEKGVTITVIDYLWESFEPF
jgi:hypothetical protein